MWASLARVIHQASVKGLTVFNVNTRFIKKQFLFSSTVAAEFPSTGKNLLPAAKPQLPLASLVPTQPPAQVPAQAPVQPVAAAPNVNPAKRSGE